jgi:3'-5' exoribonuclease
MHHAWFGGLLEHTVWVVDGCLRLIDNYPELNRDMVIAGAVLHDIGKVDELDGQHAVDYTVDGRLIGHIILGRDILLRHARLVPDFPQDALRHLEHILLSHQGEREWGSPVLPATPEAFLIHLVDNLDAKLRMFLQAMERAPADQPFTEFHHALERRIFLGWQRSREEPEGHRPSP